MKVDMLLDAIGKVDDAYIVSVGNGLQGDALGGAITHRSVYRKAMLTAATIFLLLVSTFTVALATNEEFRDAVFQFFHITTPDRVLPAEEEPDHSGTIENIGSTNVENLVSTEYIRVDGKYEHLGGAIYVFDEEAGKYTEAYTVEDGQLIPLEAHYESLEYSWDDTDFQISFYWFERDGILYAMERSHEYGYVNWRVSAYNNTDLVVISLEMGQMIDYREYALLYNVRTHEVIDFLDECEAMKNQNILEVHFYKDKVLLTCGKNDIYFVEDSIKVYYYDIENKIFQDLSELCGMNMRSAWFIDSDTIGCCWYDAEDHCVCKSLSISSGESFEIFSDLLNADGEDGLHFPVSSGRYGLYVDENKDVYVCDFKTGDRAVVENFKYDRDANFVSINGNKMLFTQASLNAEGFGWSSIGILDLEKRAIVLFDREGYEVRDEASLSWFDQNRVAIWAIKDSSWYLYLITIHDEAWE